MIKSSRILSFLVCCLLLVAGSHELRAQEEEWPSDPIADAYVSAGKQFLAQGSYQRALEAFDSALMRPFHPRTTSATYLKGLAWFYQGEEDSALATFTAFEEAYPASAYLPEVLYHKAILLVEGWPDTREEGLIDLLDLWRQDSLPELAISAKNRVVQYLFESCDTAKLRILKQMAPEMTSILLQPECFCLKNKFDQEEEALSLYQAYLADHEAIPFLERLFDPRREDRYGDRENIRIAIFLPLFLDDNQNDSIGDIPSRSRIAVEFWEGMKMAYEGLESELKNRVTLRVFDTRRDSLTVEHQLQELDAWYPDLVIGAVYNTQTEVLSRWSEQTGTPQIVPFSPSQKLVEDKLFTFLAHPDINVHGEELADYGFDSLGMTKVAVFSNLTKSTEQLAQPFMDAFRSRGGEVIRIEVDSVFEEESAKDLVSMIKSLKLQEFNGVFIPIFGDQETTGLILSQISVMDIEAPVLASPHIWKRFSSIDRELKERHQVIFSTSFMCDKLDTAYLAYLRTCLEQYHIPPSDFHTQGYDIGMYVLTVLNEYPFRYLSLADYIRNYPAYEGLHERIEFKGSQSNQTVNLGQFTEEGIIRLSTDQPWLLSDIDNE